MKTLVCLTALSLMACTAPFSDENSPKDTAISEAGSPDMLAGTGGSAGNQTPQAGQAPSASGGSDSGMAGSPTTAGVGGNSPMAGMAGKAPEGSAGSGMAGMPSAGSGNAGSPSMAGTGGSDSSSAGSANTGMAGMDSGTGGTTTEPNDCDATGRVGNWSPIEWDSGTGNAACSTVLNRIAHGLLTLSLSNGCTWQADIDSADSWIGCSFSNTLTCPSLGTSPAFTAKVTSRFTGGQLGGMLSFDSATAGACSDLSSVSFSATRN